MVSYNGKVTMGAGHSAHKAGYDIEPLSPCVTGQMTPAEREFYGVGQTPKRGAKKKMKKKRGPRINIEKLKEMVEQGYTAANIAVELETTEEIVWERAKARGLITMLRANEEEEEVVAAEPDPEEEEVDEPEDETVEPEYPQDSEENEYRFISPEWLDAIARGLTKGAVKHPGETWRTIPAREHLFRAMRHINLYLMGDRTDDHICNASMRIMMAFETAKEE